MLKFTLNISATGFGQISFIAKDKQIKEVFDIIEKQSKYRFFYNDDMISIKKVINMEVKGQSIEYVLNRLFERTGFAYKIMDNNLVVITLKNNSRQYRDSTKITDRTTGKPLAGVTFLMKSKTPYSSSDTCERSH